MRTRFATDQTVSATDAQTGAAVATADASDLATAEALANALKTDYNKTITDLANIKTEIAALRTKLGI